MAIAGEKVNRWGMIAMVWQIAELHGGPSRESEQLTERLRLLPGDEDQKVEVQDVLDAMPLGEDDEQPHDHISMFATGLLLWNDATPEESLTYPPALQYFRLLIVEVTIHGQ